MAITPEAAEAAANRLTVSEAAGVSEAEEKIDAILKEGGRCVGLCELPVLCRRQLTELIRRYENAGWTVKKFDGEKGEALMFTRATIPISEKAWERSSRIAREQREWPAVTWPHWYVPPRAVPGQLPGIWCFSSGDAA